MKHMRKSLFFTLLFALPLLILSPVSQAHFHYEIAVSTKFIADKNQLKSLDLTFLYDPGVSDVYLEDIQEDSLNQFAKGLVKDLAPLHYFTELKLNGKTVKTGVARNAKAVTVGKGKQQRLKVSFNLPLAHPVALNGKSVFRLLHVDTTASATLYYDTLDSISFSPSLAQSCSAAIQEINGFKQGEQPQKVTVVCVTK